MGKEYNLVTDEMSKLTEPYYISYRRKLRSGKWLFLGKDKNDGKAIWDPSLGFPMLKNGTVFKIVFSSYFSCFNQKNAEKILEEINRVLVNDGTISITVPDFAYVALTFTTKYYSDPNRAIKLFLGNENDYDSRRLAYSYSVLANLLQQAGFTRIEKKVCPIRRLKKSRVNNRTPIDRLGDFPPALMTVIARKPKTNDEPAFITVDELPTNVLEKSLTYHGRRLLKIKRKEKKNARKNDNSKKTDSKKTDK